MQGVASLAEELDQDITTWLQTASSDNQAEKAHPVKAIIAPYFFYSSFFLNCLTFVCCVSWLDPMTDLDTRDYITLVRLPRSRTRTSM